jgi:hypothetical protein
MRGLHSRSAGPAAGFLALRLQAKVLVWWDPKESCNRLPAGDFPDLDNMNANAIAVKVILATADSFNQPHRLNASCEKRNVFVFEGIGKFCNLVPVVRRLLESRETTVMVFCFIFSQPGAGFGKSSAVRVY